MNPNLAIGYEAWHRWVHWSYILSQGHKILVYFQGIFQAPNYFNFQVVRRSKRTIMVFKPYRHPEATCQTPFTTVLKVPSLKPLYILCIPQDSSQTNCNTCGTGNTTNTIDKILYSKTHVNIVVAWRIFKRGVCWRGTSNTNLILVLITNRILYSRHVS